MLLAAYALAGQQGVDYTPGIAPTISSSSTLGVSLAGAVGCRCSIRVDAGTNAIGSDGFNATGYLVPFYYDPSNYWVEGQSSLHCAMAAKLDGGRIRQQVCPDIPVAARFGRVLCTGYGIKGYDAGTGADLIADSGVGPQPVVRTECWGPTLSSTP